MPNPTVSGVKLSQIQPAASVPAMADQLAGISGGNTDNLFSLSQVALTAADTYPFTAAQNTNIGAALNTFMQNVSTASPPGGTVLLPPGSFNTSVQIVVPTAVRLKGAGKRLTSIIASGLATSTAVVRLGRVSDSLVFDCALQDLGIGCNLIAGSIGVYGINLNEGCGGHSIIVNNNKDTGIFLDTGCIHGRWTDIEIDMTNSPSNYGMRFNGGGHEFDRVSISGNGVGNCLAAVYSNGAYLDIKNINMEFCTDGLLIGNGSSGSVVSWGGNVVTNLVHFTDASDVALIGGLRSFATNLIKDDVTGATIGNTYSDLPYWSRIPPRSAMPPTVPGTSPYTITNFDTTIICTLPAGLAIVMPNPLANTGREITVLNQSSQPIGDTQNSVIPLTGGDAQNIVCVGTAGKWVIMQSNGTAWNIIASN